MTVTFEEPRPLLFGGAPWYGALEARGQEDPLWYFLRNPVGDWWVQLLASAVEFAQSHGLLETIQARFAPIPAAELREAKAVSERRGLVDPIWEIANELVVGSLLARVLGWQFPHTRAAWAR